MHIVDNETEMVYTDVQRKITAWRTTNPALDNPALLDNQDMSCSNVTVTAQRADKSGLILVTSLIDKLPNLGGIVYTALQLLQDIKNIDVYIGICDIVFYT